MGAQLFGFAMLQPFRVFSWLAYVPAGDGPWPNPRVHQVAAPSMTSFRGSFMLLIQLFPQPFYIFGGEYNSMGLADSHPISSPFQHGSGVSFPGCVQPNDKVHCKSASCVVIGYQVE